MLKAIIVAAGLSLLCACATARKSEPVVTAVGAGVEERISLPIGAAAPTTEAVGVGVEMATNAPAAKARVKK